MKVKVIIFFSYGKSNVSSAHKYIDLFSKITLKIFYPKIEVY